LDFEFGVAGVQREGGGVCFAGFDGAGEEVEGEELHCGVGVRGLEGVDGCGGRELELVVMAGTVFARHKI
jgi:hypothetical protein